MTLHEIPHIPLRNERGAFDLPSILIGVVVVAVLTAGVLAAVFGAIPFAQEEGAKQDLASVRTAEGTQLAQSGAFLGKAALESSGSISSLPSAMQIFPSRNGAGYCASIPSQTGKTFIVTGKNSQVREGTCEMTWVHGSTKGIGQAYALAASADGTKLVFAPQFKGTLARSTDSGATWTDLTAPGSRYWEDIASSSDGSRLVAVAQGAIVTSTDSGATWTEHAPTGSANYHAVASSADGLKLAVAADSGSTGISTSIIFISADGGLTWTTPTVTGRTSAWMDITSSADGSRLYAVESVGGIFTSSDSGVTWTMTSSGTGLWRTVATSADGTRVSVTNGNSGGGVHTSGDSGVSWAKHIFSGAADVFSVAMSADGSSIAVGTNSSSDPVTSKYPGKLHVSTDFGATWQQQDKLGDGYWKFIVMSADGSKIRAVNDNFGYVFSGDYDY